MVERERAVKHVARRYEIHKTLHHVHETGVCEYVGIGRRDDGVGKGAVAVSGKRGQNEALHEIPCRIVRGIDHRGRSGAAVRLFRAHLFSEFHERGIRFRERKVIFLKPVLIVPHAVGVFKQGKPVNDLIALRVGMAVEHAEVRHFRDELVAAVHFRGLQPFGAVVKQVVRQPAVAVQPFALQEDEIGRIALSPALGEPVVRVGIHISYDLYVGVSSSKSSRTYSHISVP